MVFAEFFLAGQGTLHYATIFLSKFHAKRYGLLEKRDRVPKHVQRLFIVIYCLFISSFILFFVFCFFRNFVFFA